MKLFPDMDKSNTALLVVDPVNSCAHEECETASWNIHFSKIRLMLPRLAEFINRFRKQDLGVVIFTTITPWTKEYLPDNVNELYKDPEVCYYSEDISGFDEKFHTVVPSEEDLVFIKNTYDAFTNKDLVKELEKRKIKYIIMTGVFTDGCVLASVIGGFSKGFNFVILKDLVETTDSKVRQELQKLLIDFTFPKMYGKTIASSEFLLKKLTK